MSPLFPPLQARESDGYHPPHTEATPHSYIFLITLFFFFFKLLSFWAWVTSLECGIAGINIFLLSVMARDTFSSAGFSFSL